MTDRPERKLATVLFADLVGSTALAATEDPERTRLRLDRFYDAVSDEMRRAGGTVEKFAGDAVMAAFGAPAAQEDHAERALHAALALQRRVEDAFGGELALRIGVNTGEVVVGRPREGSSFVSGDAVNVAARLEQAAEAGEIIVGERTAGLVAGAFELEAARRLEAKGKPGGIEARRLVRALSLMRSRGVPGLRRAFVGRQHELDVLRRTYERAIEAQRPHLVTVLGDPGVGKTRLVRELWEWLGREAPETLRRTGRCPPYGQARAYRAVGEILREHFGLLESDATEHVLARLTPREILGLALGLDVAGDLHPLEARDRLHDAWLELVSELGSGRPVVLLVEDLHWSEEPLVELLERTLREAGVPLLLVATARPEHLDRRPTWGWGPTPSESVWLEPLSPDDVERFLMESVPTELPQSIRDLLSRAEGNPLFLEELLAALLDRGALGVDGRVDLERLPESALPDTVQALLASRIDALPARAKTALQAAAVAGRAFWPSAVRELLAGEEPDLRLLEQRDFVRRQPASSLDGEAEFVFKHALTREVAYGSLTRRERAHLHARFAAWLERRGGGRDEHAPLLAHHYAEAVRPEDVDLAWSDEPRRHEEVRGLAVRWLRSAAELATRRYEIDDALALLRRALELETEARAKIEILQEIGQAHVLLFDPQGLMRACEEALALGPERSAEAEIYALLAYYRLGRPYMWKELPPLEVGEQWLAEALELAEPESHARARALVARALSDPARRIEAATEAGRLGEELGDTQIVIYAAEARTLAATEAGRYQEACEWADRAIADSPKLANPNHAAHQYWNAAFIYARAGRFAEARRLAAAHDELVRSLTAHEEVHAVGLHAVIEAALGEWKVLAELVSRAEAATVANADFPCQFNWRTLVVCALGLANLGEESEARRLEDAGRISAVVGGPPEVEPALLRLVLLRGDQDEALRIIQAAPAPVGPWGVDGPAARLDALIALRELEQAEAEAAVFLDEPSYTQPFALRAVGLSRGDTALLHQAEARFEAMGLAWRAAETRSLAAGAL